MKTPDVIYLIDCGDEITWCDDPNPSGDLEPDDVVMYEKSSVKSAAPALLEALEAAKSKIECSQRAHERASVFLVDEALEIIDAAIKQARGE